MAQIGCDGHGAPDGAAEPEERSRRKHVSETGAPSTAYGIKSPGAPSSMTCLVQLRETLVPKGASLQAKTDVLFCRLRLYCRAAEKLPQSLQTSGNCFTRRPRISCPPLGFISWRKNVFPSNDHDGGFSARRVQLLGCWAGLAEIRLSDSTTLTSLSRCTMSSRETFVARPPYGI